MHPLINQGCASSPTGAIRVRTVCNGPLVSFSSSVGLLLCLRRLRRLIGVSGSLTLAIILAAIGVELGLELVDDSAPGLVDLLSDGRKFAPKFVDTATRLVNKTTYVSGCI